MPDGYFSKERRAERRRTRAERKVARRNVRTAKLRVAEAKEEARLARIRSNLRMLAAVPIDAAPYDERVAPRRSHAQSHSSPSHHVGSCDAACRAGEREHHHRR